MKFLRWIWPLLVGVVLGLVLRLVFSGDSGDAYNVMMLAYFVAGPVAVATTAVYLAERMEPRSYNYHFGMGALANVLLVIGSVTCYLEGWICAIIALPVFALLGGLAGLITGALCRWLMRPKRVVYSIAVLPLLLGAVEQHIPLPAHVDTIARSRIVQATPAAVWDTLTLAEDIRADEIGVAWMYRIGVPLPRSAVTEERGNEHLRHIEMGKGIRFDQVALEWQPERKVVWGYRFAPDSFPPRALDDHVRIGGDFFDLIATEYSLEPVDGGTRLTTVMTYRVSTHFNWYARVVAKLLIGNFENVALAFYAQRAGDSRPSISP